MKDEAMTLREYEVWSEEDNDVCQSQVVTTSPFVADQRRSGFGMNARLRTPQEDSSHSHVSKVTPNSGVAATHAQGEASTWTTLHGPDVFFVDLNRHVAQNEAFSSIKGSAEEDLFHRKPSPVPLSRQSNRHVTSGSAIDSEPPPSDNFDAWLDSIFPLFQQELHGTPNPASSIAQVNNTSRIWSFPMEEEEYFNRKTPPVSVVCQNDQLRTPGSTNKRSTDHFHAHLDTPEQGSMDWQSEISTSLSQQELQGIQMSTSSSSWYASVGSARDHSFDNQGLLSSTLAPAAHLASDATHHELPRPRVSFKRWIQSTNPGYRWFQSVSEQVSLDPTDGTHQEETARSCVNFERGMMSRTAGFHMLSGASVPVRPAPVDFCSQVWCRPRIERPRGNRRRANHSGADRPQVDPPQVDPTQVDPFHTDRPRVHLGQGQQYNNPEYHQELDRVRHLYVRGNQRALACEVAIMFAFGNMVNGQWVETMTELELKIRKVQQDLRKRNRYYRLRGAR
jgi:hypothetical protein